MDLRGYLGELERRGLLTRISREVSTRYELGRIVSRLQDRTLLFEHVLGYELPVLANLSVHRALLAKLLGLPESGLAEHLVRSISEPLPCVQVSRDEFDRIVCTEVDILQQFPITMDWDRQKRPALSSGVMMVRDPETGLLNTSFHVLEVIGQDEFVVHVSSKHFARIYSRHQSRGEALPAAVAVGIDPWTWLAASVVIPHPPGELDVAGAFRREPVALRPCHSVDLAVPPEAELVLEGEVLASRRVEMGPEPVPTGYYGPPNSGPVFKVKCWSRKRDALFFILVNGTLDHQTILALSREATLLPFLRGRYGGVRGVAIHGQICVISVEGLSHGEAASILSDVITCDTERRGNVKIAILVDPDVNIHSFSDIRLAFNTRLDPRRIMTIEGPTSNADPSATDGRGLKLGIDATVPEGASERYRRPYIPGSQELDLDRYLFPYGQHL